MPTCPTCRHAHAGLGYVCIGCSCPHVGTCSCSHCRTRAVLDDAEVMSALEHGFDEVMAHRRAMRMPLVEHKPAICPDCIANRRRMQVLRDGTMNDEEWAEYYSAIRSCRGTTPTPWRTGQ